MPTFSEIIDAATERSDTTRKQIAAGADAHVETVRRWICGDAPAVDHLRRLISRASDIPDALKLEILNGWFLAGSAFRAAEVDQPTLKELDADRDGRVTPNDAKLHLTRAICDGATALRKATESDDGDERAVVAEMKNNLRLYEATLDRRQGPRSASA